MTTSSVRPPFHANRTQIPYGDRKKVCLNGSYHMIKICTNCSGYLTKMAAIHIYGKITPLESFSSETRKQMTLGLVCSTGDVGPTKFVQIMILD